MTDDVSTLVGHLFRKQSGRVIGWLTRLLGPTHLHLAEDAVQFAMVQALRTWPFHGVPERPDAWLAHVARNRAIELARAARSSDERALTMLQEQSLETLPVDASLRGEIQDETLALVFACCHPIVPHASRVALTLNVVGGFGVREIARALLAEESAVAQRLVRAKRLLAERGVPFEVPAGADLRERLDAVLEVVYLTFNEGYEASHGETWVRDDLCSEALRLAKLVIANEATETPKVHALTSLLHLLVARLPGRLDEQGALLLLEDQDRGTWDRCAIAMGMRHLERASQGGEVTSYHLQAGIAAAHATADSFAHTDWTQIVELYNDLYRLDPSPVVALNRAVAIAMADGPQAGLAALDVIDQHEGLDRYVPRYAVKAELLRRLGCHAEAASWFARAIALPCSDPQRRFLERKRAGCVARAAGKARAHGDQ
jgi:RNA polymerase sigma-70 factor (ECF subfamily)